MNIGIFKDKIPIDTFDKYNEIESYHRVIELKQAGENPPVSITVAPIFFNQTLKEFSIGIAFIYSMGPQEKGPLLSQTQNSHHSPCTPPAGAM